MGQDRILVADDCRIQVILLKHILGKLGVSVDSAGDGEAALKLALQSVHAVVFADITLPVVDGFELCRRIRAAALAPRPRIVLLTARAEKLSQSAAEEAGADSIFYKPIVPSQILEIAKLAISEANRARQAVKGVCPL